MQDVGWWFRQRQRPQLLASRPWWRPEITNSGLLSSYICTRDLKKHFYIKTKLGSRSKSRLKKKREPLLKKLPKNEKHNQIITRK